MKHVENKNKNKTRQRSKRRFIITRERIPLYKWESFFLLPSPKPLLKILLTETLNETSIATSIKKKNPPLSDRIRSVWSSRIPGRNLSQTGRSRIHLDGKRYQLYRLTCTQLPCNPASPLSIFAGHRLSHFLRGGRTRGGGWNERFHLRDTAAHIMIIQIVVGGC